MRFALALCALLLSAGLAGAQDVNIQGLEIVSYGIYTADKAGTRRDANGVLTTNIDNIRISAATRTVPAQIGVKFGLQYKVVGTPAGAPVQLREVVIYPPGGIHPPGKDTLISVAADVSVKIGTEMRSDFYGFDDSWELVPGTWTFQIWRGTHRLAEQKFTVVKQ